MRSSSKKSGGGSGGAPAPPGALAAALVGDAGAAAAPLRAGGAGSARGSGTHLLPRPQLARAVLGALLFAAGAPASAAQPQAQSGPCELSITEFGAIAGATGSRAAFTNMDAINRTLAAAAGKRGCVISVPARKKFVAYGGIVSAGLIDAVLKIDGTLVAEFSTTEWPGCAAGKCKPFSKYTRTPHPQLLGGGEGAFLRDWLCLQSRLLTRKTSPSPPRTNSRQTFRRFRDSNLRIDLSLRSTRSG